MHMTEIRNTQLHKL